MQTTQEKGPDPQRYATLGMLYAFLGAAGFSAKAIFIKLAYTQSVDPVTLLTMRMSIALPFFLAMLAWVHFVMRPQPLTAREFGSVFVLGLLGYYLSAWLDFEGLRFITANTERLILFLYPTIVVVLAAVIKRKPITRVTVAALALSYVGLALAVAEHSVEAPRDLMLGGTLVFGATLSYAIYLFASGELLARVGTLRFTGLAMTVSCLAVLLHFGVTHDIDALRQPARVYQYAFAMAVFSTVLPSLWVALAIRRIGAGTSAMIGSIGPVMTIAMSYVFLGEALSELQFLGGGLIIAGVSLITLRKTGKG